MPGRTDSRLRMVAILLVFAVFATAAGLRLGYWQVVAADELTARPPGVRGLDGEPGPWFAPTSSIAMASCWPSW